MDNDKIEFINGWPTDDMIVEESASCRIKTKCFESNKIAITQKVEELNRKKCKVTDVVTVDTLLARWWKRTGHLCAISRTSVGQPTSTNSKTLLSLIAELPEAKAMLQEEYENIRKQLSSSSNTQHLSQMYLVLGTIQEKLRMYEQALHDVLECVRLNPFNSEAQWLLHRIRKSLEVSSFQNAQLQSLNEGYSRSLPVIRQVSRLSCNTLSFQDFLFNYAMTGKPLIITDLVSRMTCVPWNLQHIRNIAGHCQVEPKRLVADSVEWARLEQCGSSTTISAFIDSLPQQEGLLPGEQTYLFDWSLPLHCPQLANELFIPRYFAGDFLQRTSPGSLYHDSWPSLFIAPSGCRSELHVDAFGSNFWMALFEGRKRWLLFDRKDFSNLYPRYYDSLDPVFDVDLEDPDLDQHPLLALTQPMECLLEPGDLLFVPAGCAHRVENLETSLAISSNYVDLSNLHQVKNELKINGLCDPRADLLLQQLQSHLTCLQMSSQPSDIAWPDFHQWNKQSHICDY